MSDIYQPVFDAIRSKVSNCDIGQAVREVLGNGDIAFHAQQAFQSIAQESTRPCFMLRPALSLDGDQWCALYGQNLQEGVAGFGCTPERAMADFDTAYFNSKARAATEVKDQLALPE